MTPTKLGTMQPMRWSAFALSLTACTPRTDGPADKAQPTVPPPAEEVQEKPPMKGPPFWREPAVTHLLAVAHENASPRATVLPIKLGDTLEPLETRDWGAQPIPNWKDHFTFVVAHGGEERYAVSHRSGEDYGVWWAKIGDADADQTVSLGPVAPASMMVAWRTVLVGIENRVGQVDFTADTPAYEVVLEREEMKFKAYDLFVRRGDMVVAIDDVVTPIYADSFRIDGRGRLTPLAAFSMPGIINGSYVHAALHTTSAVRGTLYAITPYGIMDGNGQDLSRLPMTDGKTSFDEELTLNSTRHPNVLEEHVDRGTKKPTKLAAGTTYSAWTGLDLLERDGQLHSVLVAAGSRGLFVLPPDIGPDSKATPIDLGASCLDVKVVGDRVFALVEGAVVELRDRGEGLREARRTDVPAGYVRWAR